MCSTDLLASNPAALHDVHPHGPPDAAGAPCGSEGPCCECFSMDPQCTQVLRRCGVKPGYKGNLFDNVLLLLSFSDGREEYDGKPQLAAITPRVTDTHFFSFLFFLKTCALPFT